MILVWKKDASSLIIWRIHVGDKVFKVWEDFPKYPSGQFTEMTTRQQIRANKLLTLVQNRSK